MPEILPSLACNLDSNTLRAALPLLESEKVQAMEWSFDALFKYEVVPEWFTELVQTFSDAGRLIGHGVFFSLFSGKWSADQARWLQQLERLSRQFHFDHITEHFGFLTGEDFHKGAPIGIPYTDNALHIGIDRLKRIQNACSRPVGLENLAFAYSLEEVKVHGEFLRRLIEPVDGFIILDLHNIYCQLHNFELDFGDLALLYPLDRVREIHISGGSWEQTFTRPERPVRRDTHDDAVPEEVFQLLEKAFDLCPHLKYVVLEQLGTALDTEEARASFRADFYRMEAIVQSRNQKHKDGGPGKSFLSDHPHDLPSNPPEDLAFYREQMELSEILETAAAYAEAKKRLASSALANSAWGIEQWAPEMLETAVSIAQKWK